MSPELLGTAITAGGGFLTAVIVGRLTGQWGGSSIRLRHVERLNEIAAHVADPAVQSKLRDRAAREAAAEVRRLDAATPRAVLIAEAVIFALAALAVATGVLIKGWDGPSVGNILASEADAYVKQGLTPVAAVLVVIFSRTILFILLGASWLVARSWLQSLRSRKWLPDPTTGRSSRLSWPEVGTAVVVSIQVFVIGLVAWPFALIALVMLKAFVHGALTGD